MSIDALAEAWPNEYTHVRNDMVAMGTHLPDTPPSNEPLTVLPIASVPPQPTVQSLANISLRQAVLHAVNENDIESIQDSPSMGQRDVILNTLCDISPLPPAGAKLLDLIIGRKQPARVLDLSAIDLPISAILGLVPAVSSSLNKLDLTGNKRITVDDLMDILRAAPSLQQLIIFDCPLISDDDIYDLLASSPKAIYNLEFIGHSAFFRRARDIKPSCPYVPTFTCVVHQPMRQPLITSLPYFAPSRLLRSIYTLLKPMAVAAAATATLKALGQSRSHDPKLAKLAICSDYMFSSTALLHAAFTTWYEEAALSLTRHPCRGRARARSFGLESQYAANNVDSANVHLLRRLAVLDASCGLRVGHSREVRHRSQTPRCFVRQCELGVGCVGQGRLRTRR